jgi:hypothetical protein
LSFVKALFIVKITINPVRGEVLVYEPRIHLPLKTLFVRRCEFTSLEPSTFEKFVIRSAKLLLFVRSYLFFVYFEPLRGVRKGIECPIPLIQGHQLAAEPLGRFQRWALAWRLNPSRKLSMNLFYIF